MAAPFDVEGVERILDDLGRSCERKATVRDELRALLAASGSRFRTDVSQRVDRLHDLRTTVETRLAANRLDRGLERQRTVCLRMDDVDMRARRVQVEMERAAAAMRSDLTAPRPFAPTPEASGRHHAPVTPPRVTRRDDSPERLQRGSAYSPQRLLASPPRSRLGGDVDEQLDELRETLCRAVQRSSREEQRAAERERIERLRRTQEHRLEERRRLAAVAAERPPEPRQRSVSPVARPPYFSPPRSSARVPPPPPSPPPGPRSESPELHVTLAPSVRTQPPFGSPPLDARFVPAHAPHGPSAGDVMAPETVSGDVGMLELRRDGSVREVELAPARIVSVDGRHARGAHPSPERQRFSPNRPGQHWQRHVLARTDAKRV